MIETDAFRDRRILIVEDDFLIADAICEVLDLAGAEIIGPVGRLPEAMSLIGTVDGLDAVLLDLDLHGEMTYPVADLLRERRIPFVFTTGYSSAVVDDRYRHHPRCEKPISISTMLSTLGASLAR